MKRTLYPKTGRFDDEKDIIITEKLHGSNFAMGKLGENLFFATRNNIFGVNEISNLPKQNKKFIEENLYYLQNGLVPNVIIFGEMMGTQKVDYKEISKPFYMFAMARTEGKNFGNMVIKKTIYNQDAFASCFNGEKIPEYIGKVPIVSKRKKHLTISKLDKLYDNYTRKVKDRYVEGFIVIDNKTQHIEKYVRKKGEKIKPHVAKFAPRCTEVKK